MTFKRISGHYFEDENSPCACGVGLPLTPETEPGACPLNASGRDDPGIVFDGDAVAFNTIGRGFGEPVNALTREEWEARRSPQKKPA